MRIRAAFLAAVVLPLCTAASSDTAASTQGWSFESRQGTVYVMPDRKSISVCDSDADNLYAEVKYATSMLLTHALADSNGAAVGCGEDRVVLGHIDAFKLCYGTRRITAERCHDSVWTR
ncbi:hypothetical protein [Planomonospora parontospora]|uniref:hypothetical protein n=1 Tax=Planomonospora parontospora TaxID=58119 RepID=UPI00167091AB|nr:hypothetical protein [Planomonospora parontospora]GGL42707.1 hypothetical protein GCM10014719_50060 [Planomonospora parontospora subsp. antibiotica]GII18355.1 hypothetical protein Ppa05_50810 [Planomonospora parontospora subsp. antibiotica]